MPSRSIISQIKQEAVATSLKRNKPVFVDLDKDDDDDDDGNEPINIVPLSGDELQEFVNNIRTPEGSRTSSQNTSGTSQGAETEPSQDDDVVITRTDPGRYISNMLTLKKYMALQRLAIHDVSSEDHQKFEKLRRLGNVMKKKYPNLPTKRIWQDLLKDLDPNLCTNFIIYCLTINKLGEVRKLYSRHRRERENRRELGKSDDLVSRDPTQQSIVMINDR